MSTHTARERLRAEIVEVMKSGLARYGAEFPERVGDERNADAVAWSFRGIARIFKALDGYEVRDKRSANAKDEP